MATTRREELLAGHCAHSQNSIQPGLESATIYNLLLLQAVGTQQMATREELLSGNAWTCHKSTQEAL